jgi:hypothetical protein
MLLTDTTPLGLTSRYDEATNTTEITWSYLQNADISYFILEYWDEDEQKYKPFDGKDGLIKK